MAFSAIVKGIEFVIEQHGRSLVARPKVDENIGIALPLNGRDAVDAGLLVELIAEVNDRMLSQVLPNMSGPVAAKVKERLLA